MKFCSDSCLHGRHALLAIPHHALTAIPVRQVRHMARDRSPTAELDILHRLLPCSHRGKQILEMIFRAFALLPELHGLTFRLLPRGAEVGDRVDRKSTRLNSSHLGISYAVFCL